MVLNTTTLTHQGRQGGVHPFIGRRWPSSPGLRHDRIVAPFVLDGPLNGIAFTAWVEQCLAPTLNPGDIVILDNLGSHKGKPARNAIRDAGHSSCRLTAPISIRSR